MKHSINYTRLPDTFVAFDMYDKFEDKFWSRDRLEKALENTSIPIVPVMRIGKFKNKDEFVKLVGSESKFYDGQVEGIYVRICEDGWLVDRGKIARKDFICGDGHWSKGILTKNLLKDD